jgi:hypothetical protein
MTPNPMRSSGDFQKEIATRQSPAKGYILVRNAFKQRSGANTQKRKARIRMGAGLCLYLALSQNDES